MNREWALLVVDPSPRFALHTWRYVTRSIGFGTGEQAGRPPWLKEKLWVYSDDGLGKMIWIPTAKEAIGSLEEKLSRKVLGNALFFAVVDDDDRDYTTTLLGKLKAARGQSKRCDKPWLFVTSNRHVGVSHRHQELLRPKARKTLQELRSSIYPGPSEIEKPETGIAATEKHILITGAGFELRGPPSHLGQPSTSDALHNMGKPFSCDKETTDGVLKLKKPRRGYPVPVSGIWDRVEPFLEEEKKVTPENPGKRLSKAEKKFEKVLLNSGTFGCLLYYARRGQLDEYWDLLLEEELRTVLLGEDRSTDSRERANSREQREERKAKYADLEARMREAFRRTLLKFDWGQMEQSLIAARQNWHAWLTTNYTHFADRAIALVGFDSEVARWRVISTAAEAHAAAQDVAHVRSGAQTEEQFLFKLHGDIGDLHTMAIAGHDKDHFSPLSVKVESLGRLYGAAERHLVRSLGHAAPKIVWHIIGHSLNDRRLTQLIAAVRRATTASDHVFILVSPGIREGNLDDRLAGLGNPPPIEEVYLAPLTAQQYMARIERRGLSKTSALKEAEPAADARN